MIERGYNMTKKEKLLAGKPYKQSKELLSEWLFAQELIFNFNVYPPCETEKRNVIIKNFLFKVCYAFAS
jgi:hypothetical protein